MSSLRIVTPTTSTTEMSFAEACRAKLERVLAQNPSAMLIVYELPEVKSDGIRLEVIPESTALAVGFADYLAEMLLT